ncbi:hypothetical protein BCR39DRAFT_560141 [Naematelia encephala]|uniref:Uncharacterized protein n=1 Tax=Naematelia encephala TaxID=71784 RepID=A0A1Y2AX96_9TREE|nr:hypothetical protein BCR39DRAFT_560141 [Naematelia encephala]
MSTSRLRSPAPPPPSLPPKQDLTARNSTSYLNIDFSNPPPIVLDEDQKLAAALRDTVRISPRPKSTLLPENSSAYHSSNHTGGSRGKYTYSQSIPDLVSLGKPQLPSARMAEQNKNPFEEDEVEPSGTGRVGPPKLAGTTTVTSRGIENTATTQPSRQKYNRTLSR